MADTYTNTNTQTYTHSLTITTPNTYIHTGSRQQLAHAQAQAQLMLSSPLIGSGDEGEGGDGTQQMLAALALREDAGRVQESIRSLVEVGDASVAAHFLPIMRQVRDMCIGRYI